MGLGNPGSRYEGTRHNAGFVVVDRLLRRVGEMVREEISAAAILAEHRSQELGVVFFAKPQSFMNLSGQPVAALLAAQGIGASELLVIHDDLDLAPGRLKLKLGGGAGGHRGLLSIEEETGTRDFCRLRVGVGHPGAGTDVADYVLDRFSPSEEAIMAATYERACLGALEWLSLDLQAAMKIVNTRPPEGVEPGGSGC